MVFLKGVFRYRCILFCKGIFDVDNRAKLNSVYRVSFIRFHFIFFRTTGNLENNLEWFFSKLSRKNRV